MGCSRFAGEVGFDQEKQRAHAAIFPARDWLTLRAHPSLQVQVKHIFLGCMAPASYLVGPEMAGRSHRSQLPPYNPRGKFGTGTRDLLQLSLCLDLMLTSDFRAIR